MTTSRDITPSTTTTAAADAAITSRRSIRAFLPTPVPQADIEALLAVAARAPSGTNTQPWQVHVLMGAAKEALSRDIRAAYDDPQEREGNRRVGQRTLLHLGGRLSVRCDATGHRRPRGLQGRVVSHRPVAS